MSSRTTKHARGPIGDPAQRGQTRLNLGCGADVRPGFLNVDSTPGPGVDASFDFDAFPWPLPDAHYEEILASHILEHVEDPFGFLTECARVLRPAGRLVVYIPYWKNPVATWGNFDHKRAIHPAAFRAFGPTYAGSTDLVQQRHAGLFSSIDWRMGDRTHRWGQSRFAPGFLRIGRSRLGIFSHLWYRLRIQAFLHVEEIKVTLVRGDVPVPGARPGESLRPAPKH